MVWNMNTCGYTVTILLSAEQNTCKPSTQRSMRNVIFYCIYVCIWFGNAHMTSCYPFCFLTDLFLSIFSSEVHLPSHVLSALLCVPFQATIWSRCAFPWSRSFFLNVIDPFSSMQVCSWCSFFWLSDWQKLFKLFLPSEVNSKDIGGWVGGELGVGCRARVRGGWQTRLNCFKTALFSSKIRCLLRNHNNINKLAMLKKRKKKLDCVIQCYFTWYK